MSEKTLPHEHEYIHSYINCKGSCDKITTHSTYPRRNDAGPHAA
eukprot:gene4918-15187_t